MTTKTTLSDEETAQRGTRSCSPKATRSLCAFAAPSIQSSSNTVPPRNTEFLIANLKLEFKLNHRKQSPLKISNRKYFAIFPFASPPLYVCRVAQSTISNRNNQTIRIFTKPRNISTYAISNGYKIAFFGICSNPRFSPRKGTSRDMIPALAPLQ